MRMMRSGLDPGAESYPPYKSPAVRSIPVVEWQLQYSKYCSDPLCHSLGNIYGSKPSRLFGSHGQTERNRSRAARLQMEQDLGRGTTRRGSYKTLLNKIRELGLEN
jgi:hypothetical protein